MYSSKYFCETRPKFDKKPSGKRGIKEKRDFQSRNY